MSDFQNRLPLGRTTAYVSQYDPGLLCPVPRKLKRQEIGLDGDLPFDGVDIWNAYELSWLDAYGKPVVAIGEFNFPCTSPNLIESKSLKLYLNSFNLTRFDNLASVQRVICHDLSLVAGAPIDVHLLGVSDFQKHQIGTFPGYCIDETSIEAPAYELTPSLLQGATDPSKTVIETLYSHLLKSNCLVTNQPDWASVLIHYEGPKIKYESLLRYLISYRQHNEFHEQCVERIFCDLLHYCQMKKLTVYARYTRRGGLDINPFRSNFEFSPENIRLARQ